MQKLLKNMLAHRMTRKSLIFAATFVVAAASMGTAMLGSWDSDVDLALGQATRGGRATEPAPAAEPVWEIPLPVYAYAESILQIPNDEPEPETAPAVQPQIRYFSPPEYWAGADEGFRFLPNIPLSEDLQRYTYTKCLEIEFDYTLALAIMWGESNFRPGAVAHNSNGTSDRGIMQINDINREWLYHELAIDDLFNPYQNIDAGIEILRRLNEKYGQHRAVMAYQMGEAGMLRLVGSGADSSSYADRLYQKQLEIEEMLAGLDEE